MSLQQREMVNEMRDVVNQLEQIDTNIDMTYAAFKQKVLPMLLNDGKNFNVQEWIKITSHPNVGIRVQNVDGSVKYHIPAFLDSREISTRGDLNLTSAMGGINEMTSDNPAMKGTVIYNMLNEFKASDGDMLISSIESTLVLNQIFKDHEQPLIALPEEMLKVYTELTGKVADIPKAKLTPAPTQSSNVMAEDDDTFASDEFDLP